MIKQLFCKIKGHYLVLAGSCPFTGRTYNFCERCTKMIEAKNE